MVASIASSSWPSVGSWNFPALAKVSIAPLPVRVGMMQETEAPQSIEKSTDRLAHSTDSFSSTKGGCSRTKERRSIWFFSNSEAAALKSSRDTLLLSLAKASGWTVSRPSATSSFPGMVSLNLRQRSPTSAGWHSTMTRSYLAKRLAIFSSSEEGMAFSSKKLPALYSLT